MKLHSNKRFRLSNVDISLNSTVLPENNFEFTTAFRYPVDNDCYNKLEILLVQTASNCYEFSHESTCSMK